MWVGAGTREHLMAQAPPARTPRGATVTASQTVEENSPYYINIIYDWQACVTIVMGVVVTESGESLFGTRWNNW